jgi:hypothetical protein
MKRLQRQVGNARLNRMFTNEDDNALPQSMPDGIQRLTVSHPEDDAEKEADAMSRQVTSGQDAPPISRLAATNIHTLLPSEREDKLTRAPEKEADNDADADTSTAAHAISHKDAGSPVDSSLRNALEPRMGADLSGARVHNDNSANKAADSVNARAFTHGSDIFLGTGESATDARLMAHELTHVMQQSPESTVARAKKPKAEVELPVAPGVLELKGAQEFPPPILQFFEEHKGGEVIVNARFGQIAQGRLNVRVDRKGKFTIKPQPLALTHPLFARLGEAAASLSLIVETNKTGIGGYIGPAAVAGHSKDLEKAIEKAPDLIGLAGFTLPDIKLTNELKNGQLNLGLENVSITLGAAFSGTVSLTVVDENVEKFEGHADIAVKGLGTGSLELKRQKEGLITGKATVNLELPANFKGAVDVAWDGQAITGEGKVGYTGEKLSGEVTLKLMEKGEAAKLEQERKAPAESAEGDKKPGGAAKKPATKAKKTEYVVFGEGDLNFAFNEWLNGSAHVIVDPKGFVTIIGEIKPQKEFELFKQDDVVKPLFSFEARASYGIPVVGNIFIYGKVSLDAFAKLGPGKLYNIAVKGNYSTDPEKNKEFTIEGSINISAAAGLRLRAEAGAGIEILSHDIKAGAGINGIAGIKAYAEATPVIGYREKAAPGEDKKGEFFISGTLDIAAQPFLGLSGDLFIELDTPWWSPLSDDRWTWPLFNKEYPLGGTLGTRVAVDHVIGSKQLPSVEFQPVEFDSSKFMTDLYHDNTKPKSAEAKDQPAQWQEKNDPHGAPPAGDGAKGDAKPGSAGELPPAKSTVSAGGPKTKGKEADPNERTVEGKSIKELQDEATKKGKKPDGPPPKGGPEKSPEKKDETPDGGSTSPVELSLSMSGTPHKLILTPSTPPKLEMESKRDLFSNKIGRAVNGLMKYAPGNVDQIDDLKGVGKIGSDLQKQAKAQKKDPKNLPDVPGFERLKDAIEAYSKKWKIKDFDDHLTDSSTTPTGASTTTSTTAPPPPGPDGQQISEREHNELLSRYQSGAQIKQLLARGQGASAANLIRLADVMSKVGLPNATKGGLSDDALLRYARPGILAELEPAAKLQAEGKIEGLHQWITFNERKPADQLVKVAAELREARRLIRENPGTRINVAGDVNAPIRPGTKDDKMKSFDLTMEDRPTGTKVRSIEVTTLDNAVAGVPDITNGIHHAVEKAIGRRDKDKDPLPGDLDVSIRMSLAVGTEPKGSVLVEVLEDGTINQRRLDNNAVVRTNNIFMDLPRNLNKIGHNDILSRVTLIKLSGGIYAQYERSGGGWKRI